ncbi:E3 ubiquitin-protein ligase AIP2-like isoform X3 [Malus domestica]|uniref:E3 ubiquitin-protein ligase AIP2-like isoform X3 n=1 Tax=Malus domestica TaxID=3750 RepID=UPI0010AAC682|nr:E3 ubiquitin-protein ligase AIP2-like isoform X3 [Malus domestica]
MKLALLLILNSNCLCKSTRLERRKEEHNSSPICRHELQTDDHEYESWKEREEEAEEDRKGAANAIGGGEYMHGAFKCGRRVSRPKAGSRATCRRT